MNPATPTPELTDKDKLHEIQVGLLDTLDALRLIEPSNDEGVAGLARLGQCRVEAMLRLTGWE